MQEPTDIFPAKPAIFPGGLSIRRFYGKLFSPLIKLVSPTPYVYMLSLILVGIGALVGMIGSASAVKRYLKI